MYYYFRFIHTFANYSAQNLRGLVAFVLLSNNISYGTTR